ncbi:immunity 52 family protein [Xenorhabdus bovienii]|uniref:immunity 52 family protein n=1 Tax=Xenorhabdus bovienii TaxID=40576 RepID=UPI00237D2C90|nr:immunity 52 family protein [Xenorhabdus bovienii]MDE1486975.1 immunity 52 family protein [Xenorhabdus bovienii]MDE1495637.1 immunity 52 family protein [Xenorhabdus bovienii]MDE9477817.1 immunity 52 family protein [Xenorhabdus bovienii]MDE9530651.1 immunity 52 family protein [Xenorhabdus bovienii]
MSFIHPRMKLFYDLREEITPDLVLFDTYQIMKKINEFSNISSGWHLPGYTLKEIQENNVFNENGLTDYAIQWYKKDFDNDIKSIIKTLFDFPGDVKKKNTIMYMCEDDIYSNPNRLGKTNISISLNLEKEKFNFSRFIDFIKNLISHRYSPFIMTDTRGYSLKQKQVFPDRIYAGWMLYLPTEIDTALVPMAEEIISISDKSDKKGSLIITTKEIFDIENQNHINKANDIEICLRNLGLLPLYSEV